MSSTNPFNQAMWNQWVEAGKSYTKPLTHEQFVSYKDGDLRVGLTIGKTVPVDWFDKLPGKKILGLACGGGQQGPILASHGYDVTIMDFSEKQLEGDTLVAKRENLTIRTVLADMTTTFPFDDQEFDGIFCPVSNCFIESLENLWKECFRVLRPNGLLMVGYLNPWLYMFDADDVWDHPEIKLEPKYALPFNSRELEKEGVVKIDPNHGYEYSHTLESQIGGQINAGFSIIGFYESNDERSRLSQYGNLYLANLSKKT